MCFGLYCINNLTFCPMKQGRPQDFGGPKQDCVCGPQVLKQLTFGKICKITNNKINIYKL